MCGVAACWTDAGRLRIWPFDPWLKLATVRRMSAPRRLPTFATKFELKISATSPSFRLAAGIGATDCYRWCNSRSQSRSNRSNPVLARYIRPAEKRKIPLLL